MLLQDVVCDVRRQVAHEYGMIRGCAHTTQASGEMVTRGPAASCDIRAAGGTHGTQANASS